MLFQSNVSNRNRKYLLLSHKLIFSITFLLVFQHFSFAQSLDSLNLLNGHKAKVYYSDGTAERAKQIVTRCDKVIAYYKDILGFEPVVNVLVLNPADWPAYSAKGAVYGMPHYTGSQSLVVASEDNIFW